MSFEHLKTHAVRAVLFCTSFVVTALLFGAVGGAFHRVSSQPVLRDTPEARATMAGCDLQPGRRAQRECVHGAVAAARARDAAGTRFAAAEQQP